MRVALVHYWLTGMRGGERVLEALCELYPDADIFTLVADRGQLSEKLNSHNITTSFLQKIGGLKYYKKLLWLMPFALEAFDLRGYDLIISSEAGPAKAIVPPPDALHICYCHSPMRYIWDQYHQYYASVGWFGKMMMSITSPLLRAWDVTTASRVDHFVANSSYVAKRIEKYYRRTSTVIHPPVDISRFSSKSERHEYYLFAGQVTPYKRLDIAISAFNELGLPLHVAGAGVPAELKRAAKSNIQFLGSVSDETMAAEYASCIALVFPALEDFGIVPVEALASGRPVIAYGKGGAAETISDQNTGILFEAQTADALVEAVLAFEEKGVRASEDELRASAQAFDGEVFKRRFAEFVDDRLRDHHSAR